MTGATAATADHNLRLFTPTRKAMIRLEREVIIAVAREKGIDFLDLETRFQNVRSALVHLCHHTSFRSSLDDQIKELIRQTEIFLGHPGVRQKYSKQSIALLAQATQRLQHAYAMAMQSERINKEDVELFVELIDRLREVCLKNEYSPVSLADPYVYAQAQLIAANFPAYDRTLNET